MLAVVRRRSLADDSGFTLPELLITVVISGIIATSIGATIVVMLRLMEQSKGSLGTSGNTIFASAYFGTDVQEATTLAISPTTASCGTGTLLVEFRGDDFGELPGTPATAPNAYKSYVSYVTEVVSNPSGPDTLTLKRHACWEAAAAVPPFTPLGGSATLATQLSTTSPPTVACYQESNDPTQVIAPGNIVACTGGTARLAVMTLTESGTGTVFQLVGSRRTQT